MPIGLVIGTVAGYIGGWVDNVLMRITDIFLAFPRLILALALVAALGAGIENAVLAIAVTTWSPYARIARAEVLTIRHSEFIMAAQAQGASTFRILRRHVMPLCLASVIVRLTLDMAGIILTAAGLGFLGLGAQPPTPEWGAMISNGRQLLLDQWWVPTIPGIAIFTVSLGFCLLGDGLRDVLDPKTRPHDGGMSALLTVEDLHVTFATPRGTVEAVRGVSFELGRERLGIVGESGSGKSQTGRALLRLSARNGRIRAKRMEFDGIDLMSASEREMRDIRGARISMIMQDPRYSLNPVVTVGEQISEAFLIHSDASRREARERTLEMLATVQIRDPERVYGLYPHEVSGGMGQRVMIAMMLIPSPDLIIADEPTSALDVTVQMQVLALLDDMVRERGMGLILISHDLNLVATFCDRVLVMYGGRVMEVLEAGRLHEAQHPYTRGLLNCLPDLKHPHEVLPVLERDPAWLDA